MDYYTHHTGNYFVEQISDTVGVLRNSDNVTIGQIPIEIVEDSMRTLFQSSRPKRLMLATVRICYSFSFSKAAL